MYCLVLLPSHFSFLRFCFQNPLDFAYYTTSGPNGMLILHSYLLIQILQSICNTPFCFNFLQIFKNRVNIIIIDRFNLEYYNIVIRICFTKALNVSSLSLSRKVYSWVCQWEQKLELTLLYNQDNQTRCKSFWHPIKIIIKEQLNRLTIFIVILLFY